MPIELKEISINFTIQENNMDRPLIIPQSLSTEEKEEMIQQCVEKVLEIVSTSIER